MMASLLKRFPIKRGSLSQGSIQEWLKEVNQVTIKKLERPIAPAVSIVKGN
jgi:hypothetical protein